MGRGRGRGRACRSSFYRLLALKVLRAYVKWVPDGDASTLDAHGEGANKPRLAESDDPCIFCVPL